MAFMVPIASQVGSFMLSNGMAALSAISGAVGAIGTYNAGVAQQDALNQQAADLDAQARAERAASHHEMAKRMRDARARASETSLAMASSGFTGDDPSSVNLATENAGTETLEQLMVKALAEQRARGMEDQARESRRQGKSIRRASTLAAFAQGVGSAVSWNDRYGGGGGGARSLSPAARVT